MNLVISDIDGVIANCEHRLSWAKAKLWDDFYDRVFSDDPIWDGISLVKALVGTDGLLVFMTGRRDTCRTDTEHWLKRRGTFSSFDSMFMRKDGDHRPSAELKKETYANIVSMMEARGLTFTHIYFIDDDPENVKAVCDGDDFVTGITFGIKRMEVK